MNALSKAMMVEALCEQFGWSKFDAKQMVELFFEEMRVLLASGRSIKLSRFGNFILRDKSERPGRNPKTGEVVPVLARRVVTFKPGLKLKEKMQAMMKDPRST